MKWFLYNVRVFIHMITQIRHVICVPGSGVYDELTNKICLQQLGIYKFLLKATTPFFVYQ